MTLGPEVERFRALLGATYDRESDVIVARNVLARTRLCGHPWTSMSNLNRVAAMTAESTSRFEAAIDEIARKHGIKTKAAPPAMSPFEMLASLFMSGGGGVSVTFTEAFTVHSAEPEPEPEPEPDPEEDD